MTWQFTNYTLVLGASTLFALLTALLGWRQRATPGSAIFALTMLAVAEWCAFAAVEHSVLAIPERILSAKLEYIGIASVAPLWLLFTLEFTRTIDRVKWRSFAWLWAAPAITLALVATNEMHGLIWSSIAPSPRDPEHSLSYAHGAAFWLSAAYNYSLLAAAMWLLIRAVTRFSRMLRMQTAVLMTGALIPWVGNVFYLTGLNPLPGGDITPLAFALSGFLFLISFSPFRIFQLLPAARDMLVENMPDGLIILDAQNRVADINPAAERRLGLERRKVVGKNGQDVFGQWEEIVQRFRDVPDAHVELAVSADPQIYADINIAPLRDRDGQVLGRIIRFRNITERKRVEEQLRLQSVALDAAGYGIVITDRDGKITWINPAFTQLTGYTLDEIVGRRPSILKSGSHNESFYRELWDTILAGNIWHGEVINRRKDGTLYTEDQTIAPVHEESGQITHFIAIKQDITSRKQAEFDLRDAHERLQAQYAAIEALQNKLQDQAVRDPLTGLFNRRYLGEALDREIERTHREGRTLCVVVLDLDHFKNLNDTYGHKAGDLVLQGLADMLLSLARTSDAVCRYGGEEFVVVMPGASLAVASARANQWRQTFQSVHVTYEGHEIGTTFSAGVAAFSLHGQSGEEVLIAADRALYHAKVQGRNRVVIAQASHLAPAAESS